MTDKELMVVILCTAALFLSGYVIQQRTLRDLRQAIKPTPRPSPKMFLPDRFKQSTTELADGTVVILDDDGGGPGQKPELVVEVKPSVAEDPSNEQQSNPDDNTHNARGGSAVTEQPTKTTKSKTKSKGSKNGKRRDSGVEPGSESPQKPMSRAERRRRIKEEIMRLSQGQERGYYQRRLW
jgi:hypothetical protein